jgi:DNA-binding GntR family transcriptional regulator
MKGSFVSVPESSPDSADATKCIHFLTTGLISAYDEVMSTAPSSNTLPPSKTPVGADADGGTDTTVDAGSDASASSTARIVGSLTRAIVEHRLHPGTKLAEQKLADHFGVSRTLVRQALFQMTRNHLIRMEPARGAFVATPSADEARQVFAVRRMLEAEMTRVFVQQVTPAQVKALKAHVAAEKHALASQDVGGRTELLGDFHVRMAELMGNEVLAQLLGELISRCALITLMYQSTSAAEHSSEEHSEIIKAIAAKDEALAVRLMNDHLQHVEQGLQFDRKLPSNDISMALSS